jgi:aspartate/methionine/tyrosine aminotransferase
LIASPSNPTGTVIASAELASHSAVNALCGAFNSMKFIMGWFMAKTPRRRWSLVTMCLSSPVFKIFWHDRLANRLLIVPEAFIEATEKLAQNIFIATSTISQYAALAAFDERTLAELERRRAEFEVRRDFLYDNLLRLGFEIPIKPDGAFYIYANCSKLPMTAISSLDLLEAEAVAVTPGKDFDNEAGHYIRFAYTTSIDRMSIAAMFRKFINKG